MQIKSTRIIYPLFFFSGTAGLIYEIVWSRLLVLIFGSTTNSIVAVISAFLGGLAIGSLIFGQIADKLTAPKLIKVYSYLESTVAITAALTLILIPAIKSLYANFSDGSSVTLTLLIIKFIFSIAVLLIPTILMGATLPTLVKFTKDQNNNLSKSVSLLYAVNTFGGVLGVFLAAFVLIELVGLRNTLLIAAAINLTVGFIASLISTEENKYQDLTVKKISPSKALTPRVIAVIFAFSFSGFISIAYEILWTRILTPTMGTFIYAFATILAIYILGIAVGSLLYEKLATVIKAKNCAFALCEVAIGAFATISVLLAHNFSINNPLKVAIMVLPATIFMGLTFPSVVSLISKDKSEGKIVGISYFGNTIGSIIGGFTASFLLLKLFGSSQSIVILALFNFSIGLYFLLKETQLKTKIKYSMILVTALLFLTSYYLVTYQGGGLYQFTNDLHILASKMEGDPYSFKEDEVASVFAFKKKDNSDLGLYIDGVATTSRVAETRLMAHIPITLHPNPQRVLVICFGMGTTFRSALKHNLQVDAVELVPTVPQDLNYFQPDATAILNNPKGKIIINDGRNFAFLSKNKYDIVTIDPPPPFNAAGTSVLHSKEFYQDLTKILNPGGIVSQWIYYYNSRQDDIAMAIKSFIDVFPNVVVYQKNGGVGGLFLEGSKFPIDDSRMTGFFNDKTTTDDLKEIFPDATDNNLSQFVSIEKVANRQSLLKIFGNSPELLDNQPRTEYYLLRHIFKKAPLLTGNTATDFVEAIKKQSR